MTTRIRTVKTTSLRATNVVVLDRPLILVIGGWRGRPSCVYFGVIAGWTGLPNCS